MKRKTTISGLDPVNPDAPAPNMELKENGQHKDYWVLPEDERAKGFIRPYRDTYYHTVCQATTTMSRPLSETYARDPSFYGSTFCVSCRAHFPVSQFRWMLDDKIVGS